MKRIKFDHEKLSVLEAMGLNGPDEASAITKDEKHPDCMKLRLAAAILNSDVNMIVSLWAYLASDNTKLENTMTKNLETLFGVYDEETLLNLDENINLFNEREVDNVEEIIREAMEDTIVDLMTEKAEESEIKQRKPEDFQDRTTQDKG